MAMRVDVKVNILHTIADAIYSTPAGKIREAVANSRDNDATWVLITADQMNNRVSIMDNGHGITRDRFREIFDNIGYGLLQKADQTKLSYFGIGLMSIFRLGGTVKVFTRPRGQSEMLLLEVNTAAILDPANKDKSISFLGTCIEPVRTTTEEDRRRASVGLVNDALDKGDPVAPPRSFTEIVIDRVADDDLGYICTGAFREELTKILPLRVEDDEPFLGRFSARKASDLRRILGDPTFCRTVDVHFGTQEDGQIRQLWKYFPRFNSQITFPDDNVYIGRSGSGTFAYYVVHTVAEDLERDKPEDAQEERETGFWVRNQNFLVKSADFLDKPGPGRKPKGTIDKPLRNWVFGEVLHRDMNRFLTVSRTEFLFDYQDFRAFREEFLGLVHPLNAALRDIWKRRRTVTEGFVKPFAQVAEPDGVFARTQVRLRRMVGEAVSERDFNEDMKKRLASCRHPEIERPEAQVDTILKEKRKPIPLSDEEGALVRIDPSLRGKVETCQVRWDAAHKRVVVDVSPDLFEPKSVVFLGEEYRVVYVAMRESEWGVSVDVGSRTVYVNPFNRELSLYTVSILDIYLALEVADAVSNTKEELKHNFVRLLGPTPSIEAQKYITPLGDDLRRTAALTG